jgi:hypothetical protein
MEGAALHTGMCSVEWECLLPARGPDGPSLPPIRRPPSPRRLPATAHLAAAALAALPPLAPPRRLLLQVGVSPGVDLPQPAQMRKWSLLEAVGRGPMRPRCAVSRPGPSTAQL